MRNTISHLIRECKTLRELKLVHARIIKSPYLPRNDQEFLITRLLFVCALSDSGSLSYATDIFRFIGNPNISAHNIMIRAYANRLNDAHPCQPLILYKEMLFNGIAPDCLTFPFLLKECTKKLDGCLGRGIHCQAIKFGLCNDLYVQNSMITLYCACGFLVDARNLFDEMSDRDVVSWNSMIIGCLRGGDLDSAKNLFRKMKNRNNITWNSMITGFVQAGQAKEALELFHQMQIVNDDLVKPDQITIASVLSACSYLGAIDHGKWVHSFLKRTSMVRDTVIRTALVDMYGKCGLIERAYEVFNEMPEKDTPAWTAMISVFALHGHVKEAFNVFQKMKEAGVKPNQVTFVGLLSACAHSGLVQKGRSFFDTMRYEYSMQPQVHHYACMVDILSRAGLLGEAVELIQSMPMKADVFVWGALLGGCQMHGNVEIGEKVARYLIDLEPLNHAFYVNLCDLYGKAGRFDDMKRVRRLMNERGIKKEAPGCSMIEIDGVVHEFSIRGSCDVQMEEIVEVLTGLYDEIRVSCTNNYHLT